MNLGIDGLPLGSQMRIAYILHWEDSLESGVMKKVRAQIQKWNELGAVARAFVLTSAGSPLDGDLSSKVPPWIDSVCFRGALSRFSAAGELASVIEGWGPTLLYAREMALYPHLWRLFNRLPACLEVNSNASSERGRRMSAGAAYRGVTQRIFRRAFSGFVFVTYELQRAMATSGTATRSTVIPNGIDLAAVGLGEPSGGIRRTERSLIFIGSSGHRWHGLDRLAHLAVLLPQWQFDIVGYSQSCAIGVVDSPPNMRFHGFLGADQYVRLLQGATAGIGSLALDRVGLEEACPLKVREYLAWGLPVMTGCIDPDFPEGAPFLSRLARDPKEWDVKAIREFLESWRNRRVPREAIAHLDTAVKERARLRFLEDLMVSSGKTSSTCMRNR